MLADGLHGISDSLVIGSAIREHGIDLGDSRFGIVSNPFRNPRIADIKRRAADLFDAIETIGDEDPPSEIARLKLRAMTDIEAGAMRASQVRSAVGAPGNAARDLPPGGPRPARRRAPRHPCRPPHRATPDAPKLQPPPPAGAARPVRSPPRRGGPTRDGRDAPKRLSFVST